VAVLFSLPRVSHKGEFYLGRFLMTGTHLIIMIKCNFVNRSTICFITYMKW
jgi:hypothetical protein